MQKKPFARNVLRDVVAGLRQPWRLRAARASRNRKLSLDPGIGFGKSVGAELRIARESCRNSRGSVFRCWSARRERDFIGKALAARRRRRTRLGHGGHGRSQHPGRRAHRPRPRCSRNGAEWPASPIKFWRPPDSPNVAAPYRVASAVQTYRLARHIAQLTRAVRL